VHLMSEDVVSPMEEHLKRLNCLNAADAGMK
jgi:hypothetical protein